MQVVHDLAQAQIGDASCGTREAREAREARSKWKSIREIIRIEKDRGIMRDRPTFGLSVEGARADARTEFGSQALGTPM